MKVITTYSKFRSEIGVKAKQIAPDNEIDKDALTQIWACQAHRGWGLESKKTPYLYAKFERDLKFTMDGSASGTVRLSRQAHNALPNILSLPITVFWSWTGEEIKAHWWIDAAVFEYLSEDQSNLANYPIVFR